MNIFNNEDLKVVITFLIMNAVSVYAIFLFIDNFLQNRPTSIHNLVIAYIVTYIFTTITYFHPISTDILPIYAVNIFVNIVSLLLLSCLHRAGWRRRISCIVYIILITAMCEIFVTAMFTVFTRLSLFKLYMQPDLRIAGIVLSMLIFLTAVKLINPRFKDKPLQGEFDSNPKQWLLSLAFPFSCTIIIIGSAINFDQIASNAGYTMMVVVMFFIFNVSVFSSRSKSIIDAYENKMLARMVEASELQNALIEGAQIEIRAQKHDFKGILNVLDNMIKTSNYAQALDYIKELGGELSITDSGIHTSSSAINATINGGLCRARMQSTILIPRIDVVSNLGISEKDLTIVLSNLLSNALESTARLPDNRKIWISINYNSVSLMIAQKNTCNLALVDMRNGRFYTTKEDRESHGIGLARIERTARKYNGEFEYRAYTEDGIDYFESTCILYISTEKSNYEQLKEFQSDCEGTNKRIQTARERLKKAHEERFTGNPSGDKK